MSDYIVAPTELFEDQTSEHMRQLVGLLIKHDSIPCGGGSCAMPNFGDGKGRTLDYYDCEDCKGYNLAYDYADIGYGMSKLLSWAIVRNPSFDHAYDLTRDRLREALTEMAASGRHDRDTLLVIGGRFGMLI